MAGVGIEADPEHLNALRETEANTVKCVPDYRNRMKHVIKFWQDHYPEYYNAIVYNLSAKQLTDPPLLPYVKARSTVGLPESRVDEVISVRRREAQEGREALRLRSCLQVSRFNLILREVGKAGSSSRVFDVDKKLHPNVEERPGPGERAW